MILSRLPGRIPYMSLAVSVTVFRFEQTTDITRFLPAGSDLRLARISHEVARSKLMRVVVLTIGGFDRNLGGRQSCLSQVAIHGAGSDEISSQSSVSAGESVGGEP